MSKIDTIIDGVLKREGAATNDPQDGGGRTAFGISEAANPKAWADGKVTAEEARAIYTQKYVNHPGFNKIEDAHLQAQLIDFGVNSGPAIAIMKLQDILKVTVDGVLGPETLEALEKAQAWTDVNNLLVAARVRLIGRIVSKNPSQIKFLNGWLDRSLQFLS
mgnify:FL=1